MTNSVEPATNDTARLRYRADGLLGLSLLATLPLVIIFCSDLWFRSDLRFFPLLIIVPIAVSLWRARRPVAESEVASARRVDQARVRRAATLTLWVMSGAIAVCAPLLFSPWLALLGLTLAWIAWLLCRFSRTPWPRLIKWTLPLGILLLLPLGERSNPVPVFSSSVMNASSSLLDLLGIDHLPVEQSLQLSFGRYDVAAACRGLGNPYLLLSLIALMCMSTHCSFSTGLLTVASSPLWSWGGSVLLVVSSVWLAEQQGTAMWSAPRLWLGQGVVLMLGLLSALLLKWGIQKLLAPFMAHSAEVGGVHRFFNRVVLWPEPDPLRKRRSSERGQPLPSSATADDQPGRTRRSAYIFTIAAGLFVACGAISLIRLRPSANRDWPSFSELTRHAQFARLSNSSPLVKTTLPEQLQGMRLIDFEQFATPGTTTGKPVTSRWTYLSDKQTVIIQSDAVYRGPIAIERQRVLDGSRTVERQPPQELQIELQPAGELTSTAVLEPTTAGQPRPASEASETPAASTFRVESLTLDDPIVGRSQVSYINWSIDGSGLETSVSAAATPMGRLRSALVYQPSSACLSLWSDGSTSQTSEEATRLQQMLLRAAALVRQAH